MGIVDMDPNLVNVRSRVGERDWNGEEDAYQ